MGMLEVARDTLKDLPISEVLRERLSFALDRFEEAERQITSLQTQVGSLQAQLERERLDHEQTKKELQRLQELLREEIRIVRGVEFRNGSRTGNQWQPFCPKCHLPVVFAGDGPIYCQDDTSCKWVSIADSSQIERESRELLS